MINHLKSDRVFFKTMIAIGLPIAMQNLIASSLSMVDTIMIGQLGETEIASVGLANQITFLLHLFLFGISSGSAIFTAQYWGNKDLANVKKILGLGLVSAASLAAVFTLLAFFIPVQLLRIFTNDPAVLALGSDYLRIVGFSFILMAVSFTLSSVLRSIGEAKLPMYISAGALLMNTCLNYLLILGHFGFPALGVRGAAIATLISRVAEWMILFGLIYGRRHLLAASIPELLSFNRHYAARFFKTTFPVVLNESLWAVGVTMYIIVYARMGTNNVAAINIASTIERLSMVLFFGLANAAAVMIGNQIGAGDLKKAFSYASRFAFIGPSLGVLTGLMLIFLSPFMLSFYQISDSVFQSARGILLIYGLIMPVRVFNIVNIVGILRSGGDTRFTLMLDTVGVWVIAVPLAFLGGLYLGLPIEKVVLLIVIEEFFKAALGFWRFRSKKWINRLVGDSAHQHPQETAQQVLPHDMTQEQPLEDGAAPVKSHTRSAIDLYDLPVNDPESTETCIGTSAGELK